MQVHSTPPPDILVCVSGSALSSPLLSDLERLNTVMWRRSVVVCRPTASGLEPTSSHIIVLIALITKLHSFVPLIDKLRSCSSVPLC